MAKPGEKDKVGKGVGERKGDHMSNETPFGKSNEGITRTSRFKVIQVLGTHVNKGPEEGGSRVSKG